ncbi:MAG: hypothetical protein IRZ00_15900 [Gemmatimonadetes bacterium]|nr:hypothetical protein [Gemmatimonadota bacterium]
MRGRPIWPGCAVVHARSVSGREYTARVLLPALGAETPEALRSRIWARLEEDGYVDLRGMGMDQLTLFDGFVKSVSVEYCSTPW